VKPHCFPSIPGGWGEVKFTEFEGEIPLLPKHSWGWGEVKFPEFEGEIPLLPKSPQRPKRIHYKHNVAKLTVCLFFNTMGTQTARPDIGPHKV
jgi:hypothetical protein